MKRIQSLHDNTYCVVHVFLPNRTCTNHREPSLHEEYHCPSEHKKPTVQVFGTDKACCHWAIIDQLAFVRFRLDPVRDAFQHDLQIAPMGSGASLVDGHTFNVLTRFVFASAKK